MFRLIWVLVFFKAVLAYGAVTQADVTYALSKGLASDMVFEKEEHRLYVATDGGVVDVFDTQTHKKLKTLTLSSITDFMGDTIDSKIFSVDVLESKLLLLSQDSHGYSRLHVMNKGEKEPKQLLSNKDKMNIIKAKFVDKEHILMALISNDILLYDTTAHKTLWSVQASMSKFSNFALNLQRTKAAVVDESGAVHILSTQTGKKLLELKGENVDNIFGVDFRGDMVITGGQDRRVGVYNIQNGSHYHIMSDFFVYGVGLNEDGNRGAYSCDVENNIEIFDTRTQKKLGKFAGDKSIVNSIVFGEGGFFVNSVSSSIRFYKLP